MIKQEGRVNQQNPNYSLMQQVSEIETELIDNRKPPCMNYQLNIDDLQNDEYFCKAHYETNFKQQYWKILILCEAQHQKIQYHLKNKQKMHRIYQQILDQQKILLTNVNKEEKHSKQQNKTTNVKKEKQHYKLQYKTKNVKNEEKQQKLQYKTTNVKKEKQPQKLKQKIQQYKIELKIQAFIRALQNLQRIIKEESNEENNNIFQSHFAQQKSQQMVAEQLKNQEQRNKLIDEILRQQKILQIVAEQFQSQENNNSQGDCKKKQQGINQSENSNSSSEADKHRIPQKKVKKE